ncbi:MAG: flagellar motor protein MotA, partial [Phenylobacterium sp.]|nr:flagellar motor protein MotA [Phenylobacterium sp.]
MLDKKRNTPLIALIGAAALMMGAPAFAQDAAPADPAAAEAPADPAAAPPAEAAPAAPAEEVSTDVGGHGELTIMTMFLDAQPVGKAVLIGLALASIFSWTLLLTK